jgi:ribosome-associated translation inhibitor RaiA
MPEAVTVPVERAEAPLALTIVARGDVAKAAITYAGERLGALIEHVGEPVLFARIKLTHAPDPARELPAIAEVSLDVNGELVRAHVAAHEMHEAIDLLKARLRDKLEHRSEHRQALRRRAATSPPGEWRHGDPPTHRPGYFVRPADERELVRHKTYAVDELTPDEAAFDMEQRDFDFYLFRDLASGEDAILERGAEGSYVMTRLRSSGVDAGPTAIALTVAERPAPELTVDQAVERMGVDGRPHVFFADAATGRGTVIYRRYDGHYGLITPE